MFSIYLSLPVALSPGVYSASNRNEYTRSRKITFLGSRARQVRRVDNLTSICESIVKTMWDPRHVTTLKPSMACYRDNNITNSMV
jgi:hypothetical protein